MVEWRIRHERKMFSTKHRPVPSPSHRFDETRKHKSLPLLLHESSIDTRHPWQQGHLNLMLHAHRPFSLSP